MSGPPRPGPSTFGGSGNKASCAFLRADSPPARSAPPPPLPPLCPKLVARREAGRGGAMAGAGRWWGRGGAMAGAGRACRASFRSSALRSPQPPVRGFPETSSRARQRPPPTPPVPAIAREGQAPGPPRGGGRVRERRRRVGGESPPRALLVLEPQFPHLPNAVCQARL